jgi:hypothetical protein
MQKYLGDYEAVHSLHIDKNHVHNHIAFYSTSFIAGKNTEVL